MTIDLNVDLGEGSPDDRDLTALASSVNIACGGHAGDAESIAEAVAMAKEHGCAIGAHPSFADRVNFGRREIATLPENLATGLFSQVSALFPMTTFPAFAGFPESGGRPVLHHVKPHGALYNQAHRDGEFAQAIIRIFSHLPLVKLYGLPGGALDTLARASHIEFVPEGFIDRRYLPDGSLVPRSRPDAVILDRGEAAAQALRLVEEGRARTLCVHSDSGDALGMLEFVRNTLENHGHTIQAP